MQKNETVRHFLAIRFERDRTSRGVNPQWGETSFLVLDRRIAGRTRKPLLEKAVLQPVDHRIDGILRDSD